MERAAATEQKPLPEIARVAGELHGQLTHLPPPDEEMMPRLPVETAGRLRRKGSTLTRRKMTYDQESRALYVAVAPTYPQEHFENLSAEIEATGALKPKNADDHRTLSQRYDEWHKAFIIPKEKLTRCFSSPSKNVAPRRWLTHATAE